MTGRRADAPVFPPWVVQHTVRFEPEAPADLERLFPGVALPSSLASAVRKRRQEFLAGRWCVREALGRLAPGLADAEVGIGPDREPLWPAGVVGSITHASGYASAAVARSEQARSLGLDVEPRMPTEPERGVLERIAVDDELAEVRRTTGWDSGLALTAIFSAKECVFKALYPFVRRYFDFHDVRVEAFETAACTFHVRLAVTLADTLPAGHTLTGTWALDRSVEPWHLVTGLVMEP